MKGILNNCGSPDNIHDVKRLFIYSSMLYTPYLLSFLMYIYLRYKIEGNDEYKAVYDNFLKSKYT